MFGLATGLATAALNAQVTDCSDGYCSAPDYAKWVNSIVVARQHEAEQQRLAAEAAAPAVAPAITPPTEEQRESAWKKAKADGSYPTWLANPQAQPVAMPPQGNAFAASAPTPQPEKPKLTKGEKWARAFLILGAAAGQVAIMRQCQLLRNKPLYLYRGGDIQNLQWCTAHGY
jgi:hypothetical protein